VSGDDQSSGESPAVTSGAPTARYELHCHLDGSVRLDTIADLARSQGMELRAPVAALAVAPPDAGSLHAFLPYLDITLQVLQTPDALRRAARELVEDWQRDGVTYGEMRFAPQLHTRTGMTIDDAIEAVAAGAAEGALGTGVRTGLLLCCLRHQSPEISLTVADAAVRHDGIVAGLDLAGDERLPGTPHREAFDLARSRGLPITVHAGEAAGPDSVWEAVDVLGARRIGHGVRSTGDGELLRRLLRDRIALEMCPRSNVLTGAVPSIQQHPAHRLLRRGLDVTISTDARTTADTDLGREFDALASAFAWDPADTVRVQENARHAAFGLPRPDPGQA
jgi:adenosine deaminase